MTPAEARAILAAFTSEGDVERAARRIVRVWQSYSTDGYPGPRTRLGNDYTDEQIAAAALVCGVEIPEVDGG